MITIVNQVSSVWFDNKLLRKSLHNEKNFNKCEFTAQNSVNSSISLLILCKIADKNRQNFVGFDCRNFPLGLNTLDTDAPYSTDINTYGLHKNKIKKHVHSSDHQVPSCTFSDSFFIFSILQSTRVGLLFRLVKRNIFFNKKLTYTETP